MFCTLVGTRLLCVGTKPGNDLNKCLDHPLGVLPAPEHSRSDSGSMFLTEDQLAYAARDVFHLHALTNKISPELEHGGLEAVTRLEMQLVPVVVEIENAGIAVDRDKPGEIKRKPDPLLRNTPA